MKKNANIILSKLTSFEIPEVVDLEPEDWLESQRIPSNVESEEGQKGIGPLAIVAIVSEDEQEMERQDGLIIHQEILENVKIAVNNQVENLPDWMHLYKNRQLLEKLY